MFYSKGCFVVLPGCNCCLVFSASVRVTVLNVYNRFQQSLQLLSAVVELNTKIKKLGFRKCKTVDNSKKDVLYRLS